MIITRFDRTALEPELKDIAVWPTVDSSMLNKQSSAKFKIRKAALGEYLADKPVREITEAFGVSGKELRRLLKKCLRIHPDGRIWGARALIPSIRQKAYERTAVVKPHTNNRRGGS